MTFEFATAGRIVFGAGRAAELPGVVASARDRALVFTGSDPDAPRRAAGRRLTVPFATCPVGGEPTVDAARAAVAAAREHGADLVVAIGGGSVIDLGKAVGMLLGNGGDPLDYLEVIGRGQPLGQPSVPVVAVPTTAGTGSEVTANAVLTSAEQRRQGEPAQPAHAARGRAGRPGAHAELPAGGHRVQWARRAHPVPGAVRLAAANPMTDALAREGLRRAAAGLRRAYADGADRTPGRDMALCSLLGGMALANAKLGAVHGFAGVIGGMADVPHGAICAALLAPVTVANIARCEDPRSASGTSTWPGC